MSAEQPQANAARCNSIRACTGNRPAASFYLLTLTLPWGYWLTLPAQGRRVAPDSGFTHFPGLLGAFLLTQVCLATDHSIRCVALWPAAVVNAVVMVWGVVVAVRWRRSRADIDAGEPRP